MRWKSVAFGFLCAAVAAAADPPTLRYIPKHDELKYTFGGVAPTHHIAPGTRIITWTEDCYDGAVTQPGQLQPGSSRPGTTIRRPARSTWTGREPGDTLAIHIEKLEPARAYGISSPFPGFGAL